MRVTQQHAVFNRAAANLQRKGVGSSRKIVPRNLKNSAGRGLHLSSRGVAGAGEALHFKTAAVSNGVALGFFDEHDDVLVGIGSIRILRPDGYAIKNSQVVEPPL